MKSMAGGSGTDSVHHAGNASPGPTSAGGTDRDATLPSAVEGLDAESLARLRELDPTGSNHLLERVFQAFETSLARLLPALQAAHGAGDLTGVRHVAHTLKSSSASIGALRLAQLCAEIEQMIRADAVDADVLSSRVGQMVEEAGVVLRTLPQVLRSPS